jgi:hypothetical protein
MEVKADKLVKAYIKIRDKRQELLKQYEQEDGRLKEQLEMIDRELLDMCKEMGVENFRTEFGTVSRGIHKRYSTNDWHSFHQFVKEHDALGLLEQRIAQMNMRAFLDENPDLLPPGLNVDSKYTIKITRRK